MSRLAPLEAPFAPDTEARLAGMMPPGVPPIALFRTFVHNPRLTDAMRTWGGYELSADLSLSMRQREILIDRTCARCGCEYEWGVHVAFFAERVGFSPAQLRSLTSGDAGDACWTEPGEALLVEAADQLHENADISDATWSALENHFDASQLLDIVFLCGWYHAISFAATACRTPLEDGAPRFSDYR